MDDFFSPEAGKDNIYLERDGARTGPYRCAFTRPQLTLWYSELDICEGDKLFRAVPGREEVYTVNLVDYHQSFEDIPACYIVEVGKDAAVTKPANTTTNHINIHGSTGIQIGDHNVQNLQVALKEVLASISNADAPQEDREEAKSRLNAFLSHPLVATAVGAGLPVALGLLG